MTPSTTDPACNLGGWLRTELAPSLAGQNPPASVQAEHGLLLRVAPRTMGEHRRDAKARDAGKGLASGDVLVTAAR